MYFVRIGIALSVLLNVILGGYSNQTFSARNYMWKRTGKPNLVFMIDYMFVLLTDSVIFVINLFKREKISYRSTNHCLESWVYWFIRKDVQYDIERKVIDEQKRIKLKGRPSFIRVRRYRRKMSSKHR